MSASEASGKQLFKLVENRHWGKWCFKYLYYVFLCTDMIGSRKDCWSVKCTKLRQILEKGLEWLKTKGV